MAAAAVLRNGEGLGALSKTQDGGYAVESEALGLHLSLVLIDRKQLHQTTIEGDYKAIIDSINSVVSPTIWLARHTISDARKLLNSTKEISFSYTHRSSNHCAHQLAT